MGVTNALWRFGGLMLETTAAVLDEIVNVCRSDAASYLMLARTLGDLGGLRAEGPAGDEPISGSLG